MGCISSKRDTAINSENFTSSSGKFGVPNLNKATVESLLKEWVETNKPMMAGKPVELDEALEETMRTFTQWPRGDQIGELLLEPDMSQGEVEPTERGVALEYLHYCWSWMRKLNKTLAPSIPTRVFAEVFIPALTSHNKTALYYYVPVQFRKQPTVMVSHSWDCWLRQTFYQTEEVLQSIKTNKSLTFDQVYIWLDLFAITQHDTPAKGHEISSIGKLVREVGQTVLVLPGDGNIAFAIKPILRSWCVYEIVNTKAKDLVVRAGLHGRFGEVEYHQKLADGIAQIRVEDAEAKYASDKSFIDNLVKERFGNFESAHFVVAAATLRGFHQRYSTLAHNDKRVQPIVEVYESVIEKFLQEFEVFQSTVTTPCDAEVLETVNNLRDFVANINQLRSEIDEVRRNQERYKKEKESDNISENQNQLWKLPELEDKSTQSLPAEVSHQVDVDLAKTTKHKPEYLVSRFALKK